MEKIFTFVLLAISSPAFPDSYTEFPYSWEVKEEEQESSEFWPPDFIPHPIPPWERPKKKDEGDLADFVI